MQARDSPKEVNFLGRQIRRRLKECREKWLLEQCVKCKSAKRKGDMRTMYGIVKKVAGGSGGRNVAGNISSKKWTEHFTKLFTELAANIDGNIFDKIDDVANSDTARKVRGMISVELPTVAEVSEAMKGVKDGKAVGPDNLCIELLKNAGDEVMELIHYICCRIFNEEEWPATWVEATLLTLHKKGCLDDPNHYRGITLLPHASKIVCEILVMRTKKTLDMIIGDYQDGFREKRCTIDTIFQYRRVTEILLKMGCTFHTAFIDFQKAFDSVNWQVMFHMLTASGWPNKMNAFSRSPSLRSTLARSDSSLAFNSCTCSDTACTGSSMLKHTGPTPSELPLDC